MADQAPFATATKPNDFVLSMIARGQRYCLLAVTLIAGVILAGWLVPAVRLLLPVSWCLQKAHTSVCLLLCVASLMLSEGRRSPRMVVVSRVLAAVVVLVALETLREMRFVGHMSMDMLFSTHAQTVLILLAAVLLGLRARTGVVSGLVDAATVVLCLMIMTYTSGYLLGEIWLFEAAIQKWVSPQTLLCLNLLTVVVVARRAEYGAFGVLLDSGIGGKAARLALPVTLTVPFVLSIVRPLLVHARVLYPGYSTAVATSVTSLVGFLLVLLLARRIQGLEREVRDLSLRDDLTQLYNRRGFFLLAEQARLLARRAEEPFSVLYLDVDNLKPTNDTLGHGAGSALLREMAEVLRKGFRETDVVGRLGGDEFVVAGRMSEGEMTAVTRRLEEMAEQGNRSGKRRYELVAGADRIMYQQKREKKAKAHIGQLVAAKQR
jgi:diguanylate cyclase (GGDEF)-like protein